jgi:hypothetical protein
MRKLLFNYSLYSHPEIGNFTVWHRVERTERAFPSFDLKSPRPCWISDIVERMLGGEGSDLLYRWRVNVAPWGLLRSLSQTAFRSPRGSRLVGRQCPGCRMDVPGPTTSVGTRTDYSVGLWDYLPCAARYPMAWSTRTTEEKYSVRKLYMSRTV